MRILHLASEYPPQEIFGLGRYVCGLSRAVVQQGHQVQVLTNSMGPLHPQTMDQGVMVHRVAYPPPPIPPGDTAPPFAFNLHLLQRARSLGRHGLGDPEVVVSHDWLTAVAAHHLSKRWGVPHIWTVHDTILAKRFGSMASPGDRITDALEHWCADQADLIVVNSQSVLQDVLNLGASADQCHLVPCGIDLDHLVCRLSPIRRAAFRMSLAKPEELLLTYAGRLDVEKGIDTLINAFAMIRARCPTARLVIAGKGSLEPTIREHIQALGLDQQVRLVGYLQGAVLAAYYAVSDLHICPSHYEPFGLVAIEAMAAGTATIVSQIGGLADITAPPGVAMRVPPRDTSALAEAMAVLCARPEQRHLLGSRGAQHVRDTYNWSTIASQAVIAYRTAERLAARPLHGNPLLEAACP